MLYPAELRNRMVQRWRSARSALAGLAPASRGGGSPATRAFKLGGVTRNDPGGAPHRGSFVGPGPASELASLFRVVDCRLRRLSREGVLQGRSRRRSAPRIFRRSRSCERARVPVPTKDPASRRDHPLSGWCDSNTRPPGPKPGALTGLRYTPNMNGEGPGGRAFLQHRSAFAERGGQPATALSHASISVGGALPRFEVLELPRNCPGPFYVTTLTFSQLSHS